MAHEQTQFQARPGWFVNLVTRSSHSTDKEQNHWSLATSCKTYSGQRASANGTASTTCASITPIGAAHATYMPTTDRLGIPRYTIVPSYSVYYWHLYRWYEHRNQRPSRCPSHPDNSLVPCVAGRHWENPGVSCSGCSDNGRKVASIPYSEPAGSVTAHDMHFTGRLLHSASPEVTAK